MFFLLKIFVWSKRFLQINKWNSSAVVQNKKKYTFWSYHNRICIWKCELSRWLPVDFKARWASSWQWVDLAGCYLPCFPWCPGARVCWLLFPSAGVAQSQGDGPEVAFGVWSLTGIMVLWKWEENSSVNSLSEIRISILLSSKVARSTQTAYRRVGSSQHGLIFAKFSYKRASDLSAKVYSDFGVIKLIAELLVGLDGLSKPEVGAK